MQIGPKKRTFTVYKIITTLTDYDQSYNNIMNKDNKLLEMIIEMLLRKGFSRKMAERNAKIMIEDMATQNWDCLMKNDPELN